MTYLKRIKKMREDGHAVAILEGQLTMVNIIEKALSNRRNWQSWGVQEL